MITEILTLMEGFNSAHDFFERITGIFNGGKNENNQYLDKICQSLQGIDSSLKNPHFERLSDNIIYTPLFESVRDITQTQQKIIEDLRDVRASLEPVQQALGGEIISSAMIETPNKMQNALSRSPWEVLTDIRPAHLAPQPNNPDLVPIFFKYQGIYYIGWQLRGALIPAFDCEFSKIWTPNDSINFESGQSVLDVELRNLEEERLKVERARREMAERMRLVQERDQHQEQLRLARERLRQEQEALENLRRQHENEQNLGQAFEFETVFVDSRGNQIKKQNCKAHQKIERVKNVDFTMVYIPNGEFMMGSPEGEGDSDERPQHRVKIKPFYMSKYPVTQAQWQTVMGNNPSNFKGANRPVEKVSWNDAMTFCKKLSEMTGKSYRLPSEAEWEYACRAGTTTPFHFGETLSTDLANYDGNYTYANESKGKYRNETTEVGSFPPNGFGLYDMHGNVWEWCADEWHGNYNGAPNDGSVWENNSNKNRVLRGGSWYDVPDDARSAARGDGSRDDTDGTGGFRVARTLAP